MARLGWFSRWPRALVPFVAAAVYAVAASLHDGPARGLATWAAAVLAVGLAARAAFLARAAERPGATGARTGRLEVARAATGGARASRAVAYATWGAALVVGSAAGVETEAAGAEVVGAIGALVASLAALRALDDVEGYGSPLPRTRSIGLVARVTIALAWALVVAAHAGRALGFDWTIAEWPRATATFGGIVAAGALLGATALHALERRLELGAVERLRAAGASLCVVLALAAGAALVGVLGPDRATRLAVAIGALVVARLASHADPVKVARGSRLVVVLATGGGPLAVVVGLFAMDRPFDAPLIAGLGCAAALGLGVSARSLASSLRPAGGAWLDAAEKAREALLRWDPEQALAEALTLLREPAGPQAPSPQLWTFDPDRVLSIDAAGYPRERDEALPPSVLDAASREPEAILRAEVLDALQVRRPDLRAVGRWMDDREALFAVVVTRGGEPEGLLVVPRGGRGEILALEEARAFKSLADQLAAACHAKSSTARALAREVALGREVDAAEDRAARFEHEATIDAARHTLATTRLARAATVGIYSASARLAYEALERRTRAGAPLVVTAPRGIDPVPYVARAHLAGARSQAPLVLVDGTAAREHDVARWVDPVSSPLALADGGALVLLDAAALPTDVQRVVAQALAEKRPPWERADPLDVVLAVTAVAKEDDGGASALSRLEPALVARLGDAVDHVVHLPSLAERAEDVRAILTDRLAREGLRVIGSPVGIDDAAYARLVEYPFPGDEIELAAIVQRLVALCADDAERRDRLVVRAADVDSLELHAPAASEEDAEDAARWPPKRRG